MSVTSEASRSTRVLAWLVDPKQGLPLTWFCILLLLGFAVRDLTVIGGYLLVSLALGWVAMLAVCAVLKPPRKLTQASALAARIMTFIKALWATFVFASGAAYGGLVGVALSSSGALHTPDSGFGYLQQFVWPVVSAAAVLLAWYAAMGCAYDLARSDEKRRRKAVRRIISSIEVRLGGRSGVTSWLREVMLACVEGVLPWFLGYLAVPAAIICWTLLATFIRVSP